ncbi:hypothetical protein [Streptomyces chrestomyceticus]|uniref:hypothetical protein n=1 Tax=Streptomyces chrestomyceticus TaxID=68185 RepID=UPI0034105981
MRTAQQGGRWPTPPDWMDRCPECRRHYGVYRVAAGTVYLTQVTQRHIRVSTHIVADHPDRVPDYVPGCRRCDEHHAATAQTRATSAAMLHAAAVHRAGHLYAPADAARLI